MSKITYGFEERAWVDDGFNVHEWDLEEVRLLLEHARALEAMLIIHQYLDGYCVQCGENQYDGHSPDCALVKLLEE